MTSVHETKTRKQSRTIQELSRQLELNRQLELSRHLELNRQIDLLAGRVATIETNQKQHYEHELRLQSPETQPKQHLPTNNQPQHIKINAKRPNCYLKTKNRFSTLKDEMEGNALKNEMGNNINSTKEQITQISAEHNPQQIQSHTQPAGILKTIRKANKITNINLQNYNENKRTTKKKLQTEKNVMYFSLETASSKDKKLSLRGGWTSIKFSAAPKYDFPKQST
ncbi:hypothetical protein FHG87_025012 [Trinorchestia longiramus]|nr:hypothetical protein FHG87_025012 [Trinorchestia longiramus]